MANNVQLASDSFLSGSLAAGWSAIPTLSVCQVVSHQTEPNALSTGAGQSWTGGAFTGEQISECTIGTGWVNEAGTLLILVVRQQVGAYTHYEADISNSQLQLFRTTAGSSVQLGSTVLSLTIAAGDIWTMQAAGSCISVYQNFNHIITASDPNITGGTPGYAQYSSVNITHTKVASWRGYSNAQQSGVWQRQGVVVAPIAADLGGDGSPAYGIQCHSPILYEGGAQILSGTVYKMWVDNKYKIYYLESADGKTWTRQAAAVITGYVDSCLVKLGSTYWMYAQLTANEGAGVIAAFSSTDGVNFTKQSDNVLTLGSAGAWDSTFVTPFFAMTVIGSTINALYLGYKSGQTYYSTGLATSTDGTTFTKYGSNPVLTGGNLCGVVKSGSTYYSWLQTAVAGRDAGNPFFAPASSVRYQSTDMINWTTATASIQNTQMFGSLNTLIGYETLVSAIDVGGTAYAYITCSPGDSVQPIIGQMELAIGGSSIGNIVQFPENATSQVATDPFTSGAGDLSANWTLPTGGTKMKIIAGPYCEPTALSTICHAVYTGKTFTANQYSEFTLQALSGTLGDAAFAASVRSATATLNAYYGYILSPTGTKDAAATIYRKVGGVQTALSQTATITPHVGDVFRVEVFDGSDGFPVISLLQNGFLILQVQDQLATPLTTGSPGIQGYSFTALANAQISLWAGGNTVVQPVYPNTGNAGVLSHRRRHRIYAV